VVGVEGVTAAKAKELKQQVQTADRLTDARLMD
jgi:hypothetical protein